LRRSHCRFGNCLEGTDRPSLIHLQSPTLKIEIPLRPACPIVSMAVRGNRDAGVAAAYARARVAVTGVTKNVAPIWAPDLCSLNPSKAGTGEAAERSPITECRQGMQATRSELGSLPPRIVGWPAKPNTDARPIEEMVLVTSDRWETASSTPPVAANRSTWRCPTTEFPAKPVIKRTFRAEQCLRASSATTGFGGCGHGTRRNFTF
jgi:hypothetical protein